MCPAFCCLVFAGFRLDVLSAQPCGACSPVRTFVLLCCCSVWLCRAFWCLVFATCRLDVTVAACRNHEIFCWMLLAMPGLLPSNGQRQKVLLRLLCVPARLPPGQTPTPWLWRPGCCAVSACRNHEIFCWMLFAMPGLLTSNGQRLEVLPRLLCVPARLYALPDPPTGDRWCI